MVVRKMDLYTCDLNDLREEARPCDLMKVAVNYSILKGNPLHVNLKMVVVANGEECIKSRACGSGVRGNVPGTMGGHSLLWMPTLSSECRNCKYKFKQGCVR
ncbi:hypothetical protein HPP92_023332 [Vanilla planifolia]|uniref:Uncharacterized protein n=1 Tax=Vanilla planifolia TaxID=51239 RepID=A0A835PUZ3_VANPL|nr:hypothetical protein HPP92_023593 [Vanilla planifolia]KAG0460204.1 hypothetical protein HPP92_023332 [Vanilla planifolia]